MVANLHPQRMTLAEWAELDEPGELVDGVLVEEEMPGYEHELIVMWLGRMLGNWGAVHGVLVAGSGARFAVRRNRGRMPDLTVFLPGRARPPKKGLIEVPPSIAMEIVSTQPRDVRRDRVEKLLEYAAFRIPGYWIVNPEARTFEIFELGSDGRYVLAVAAVGGVLENIPQCLGLTLDVAALWAELDVLG